MFDIITKKNNNEAVYLLSGEINTITAQKFAEEVDCESANSIVFDFSDVTYITSAGIRIIVSTAISMDEKGGSFSIRNVPNVINDVFEMTGVYNLVRLEK